MNGLHPVAEGNALINESLETVMAEKKKILYVVRYQLDQSFNLKAKFDGQIRAFENLGLDVYYLAFDREHFYLLNGANKTVIGKSHFRIPGYFHTLCYQDLYTLAAKMVGKYQFDVVYWRAAPDLPASYQLAKTIKQNGASFLYEYPTYPQSTEKSMSFLRGIYCRIAAGIRRKIEKLVDGFVLIGEDAGGVYNGKPAINISNGINLDVIPARNREPDPDTIHILALASMCYWHGYDRLIRSLAAYQGTKNVKLHMVGGNDGGCLPEWKALVQELGLEDKVIFHGQKSGAELDEMFNLCDLGVNSLGMYRKRFTVTSELKTRECMARGLPFVYSVDDSALQYAQEPMWLRVANDDSIPDMEGIIDFALRMRTDSQIVEKLREYAKEHLSWEKQYDIVFKSFKIY